MASGRACALSVVAVVVVVAAPFLLAGVAGADCFDYCFKDCIARNQNMIDYCNYACDKTCNPGAPQRPLAAAAAPGDMGCQLSCARTSCSRLGPDCKAEEACFGQFYDGCKTKTLPRPLRAGAGAGAGMPTALGPVVADLPSSEPDPDDAFPSSEPDPDDAFPSSDPDPDVTVRPSSGAPEHQAMGPRTPLSEIHAAPPASA